jgi:hypothetical protein
MDRVVSFRQLAGNLHELHPGDGETFFFEPLEYATHEASLNGVRFQDDKRSFHDNPLSFSS